MYIEFTDEIAARSESEENSNVSSSDADNLKIKVSSEAEIFSYTVGLHPIVFVIGQLIICQS